MVRLGVLCMANGLTSTHVKVRQSKVGRQARWALILSVVLTWFSVIGMCMAIIGAGRIIDGGGVSRWIIVGPFVVMMSFALRGWVLAGGQVAEERRVRRQLVERVFQAGEIRTSKFPTGAVVGLATESAEKMVAFRVGFMSQIVASLTSPLLVLVAMGWSSRWWLAAVVAAMLPIVPLVVGGFRKMVVRVSHGSQDARKALAADYMDALRALGTLQLLGASARVAQRLAARGEDNRVAVMQLLRGNQLILFAIDAVFSLAIVAVSAGLALFQVRQGVLTPGQGITVIALSILLLEPMDHVGAFFYVGMAGWGAQRGIHGFITSLPTGRAHVPSTQPGCITMQDVSFSHGDCVVLSHAQLEIQRGQRVAIVGRSGAGKTTLLSLIAGMKTPQAGAIARGGDCAVVAQHTWLFQGTIADNLRLARPEATEEEMWQALSSAQLADEIRTMPAGLSTLIGEFGVGLSGGQAQRLSLARALISGRRIVLFDEPTAHVDLASEAKILDAINNLGRDYTVVMVTHRDTSLAHMDRIVHVTNGRIEEEEHQHAH